MRSKVAAENILARTGKPSEIEEYKDVWIKLDMTEEERKKERELRREAKEKNEKRTEIEEKEHYWRVMDARSKKWHIQEKEERAQGTQI